MLEAVFREAVIFKRVIESVKDLFTELNLVCDEHGMILQGMEKAHLAVVHVQLASDLMDRFRCDERTVMSLNMNTLAQAVKYVPNGAPLTIKNDKNNHLLINSSYVESGDVTGYEKTATIKLLSTEADILNVPNETYPFSINFPTKILLTMLKDFTTVGEHVTLSVDANNIRFKSEGETGLLNRAFSNNASGGVSWRLTDLSEHLEELEYSLKYLLLFTKATPICEKAVLGLSLKSPLMLRYPIQRNSAVSFYLAPVTSIG
eukprot:Platyproteum_vivax@DN12090_c0_g1_i1.p1